MPNMHACARVPAVTVIALFVAMLAGCETYAGKGAAQGAGTGAIAGAVGGVVTALGNIREQHGRPRVCAT
jgi:hypothetical protein